MWSKKSFISTSLFVVLKKITHMFCKFCRFPILDGIDPFSWLSDAALRCQYQWVKNQYKEIDKFKLRSIYIIANNSLVLTKSVNLLNFQWIKELVHIIDYRWNPYIKDKCEKKENWCQNINIKFILEYIHHLFWLCTYNCTILVKLPMMDGIDPLSWLLDTNLDHPSVSKVLA